MDLGGRPTHSFWKQGEFERQRLPNGKNGALCSVCKKVLANTAEQRLKNHRKNCPLKNATVNICSDQNININYNVSDENHNHCNETNLGEVQSTTDVNRPGGSELSSKVRVAMQTSSNVWNSIEARKGSENFLKNSTTLKAKRRKQSNSSHTDTLNDEEIVIINRGLIHFLITYNIDFKCIESNYFDNFIKALHPGYTSPNSLDLTTNILNEAYDYYKNTKFECNCCGILLISCQRNSNQYISMTYNQQGTSTYIDACDSLESLETFITKSIEITKQKYNVDIYAVVSNIDNYFNLPVIAEGSDDRKFWYFNCITKNINSITKSILADCKHDVNKIIMTFLIADEQEQILKHDGTKMTIITDNNYNNTFNALIPCCQNLKILRNLVADNIYKCNQETLQLLFDSNFEAKLNSSISILKAINKQSHIQNKAEYSIANAVEDWIQLELDCTNESHKILINDQLKLILNSVSLAANYLHPTYRGQKLKFLDNTYVQMVRTFFIDVLDEDEMEVLFQFEDKTGIFEKIFQKEYKCIKTFCRTIQSVYPKFCIFCKKLLTIPAYTNEQELLLVQRNDLDCEQKRKVTELFYSLKINEKKKDTL